MLANKEGLRSKGKSSSLLLLLLLLLLFMMKDIYAMDQKCIMGMIIIEFGKDRGI